MKTKLEYGSLGFLVAILFDILVSVSGCATGCLPPAERAAEHGVVLECRPAASGTTVCTVSTPEGDRVYAYRRSCQ